MPWKGVTLGRENLNSTRPIRMHEMTCTNHKQSLKSVFYFIMLSPGRGLICCFWDGLCACAKLWNRLCIGVFWLLGGQVPAQSPLWGQVWAPLCAGTWPPGVRCQHIDSPGGPVWVHRPLGGQVLACRPQGWGMATSEIELCSLLIVIA